MLIGLHILINIIKETLIGNINYAIGSGVDEERVWEVTQKDMLLLKEQISEIIKEC